MLSSLMPYCTEPCEYTTSAKYYISPKLSAIIAHLLYSVSLYQLNMNPFFRLFTKYSQKIPLMSAQKAWQVMSPTLHESARSLIFDNIFNYHLLHFLSFKATSERGCLFIHILYILFLINNKASNK